MIYILTMIFISSILSMIILMAGVTLKNKKPMDFEMQSPFECGFISKSIKRAPFSIQFYMLSLIFLIFDIELLILFPGLNFMIWKGNFSDQGLMQMFLIIVLLGLLHEWNLTTLEWNK